MSLSPRLAPKAKGVLEADAQAIAKAIAKDEREQEGDTYKQT